MELPYAETLNYWKTGKSSPDAWIEKARRQIEKLGGVVTGEAFGRDGNGRAAYMLSFEIGGDAFRVVWPVLPVKNPRDERAARVQAATMLYHDVKARCLAAAVLGARTAFFAYLMLPDGRQAAEVGIPELARLSPLRLAAPQPFGSDDEVVIDGEFTPTQHRVQRTRLRRAADANR